MSIFEKFGIKAKAKADKSTPETEQGSLSTSDRADDIFKAFIPWYLYKPPYGFPREVNPLQLRQLANNPYIFSVIKAIQDEVASVPWEIKLREEYIQDGTEPDETARKQIVNFFNNPNGNYESFESITRSWVRDICVLDSGVGVKVFDKKGDFSQLFARDGGTFLLNPDIYGYIGDRDDFVIPPTQFVLTNGLQGLGTSQEQSNGYGTDKENLDYLHDKFKSAEYDQMYQNQAAYFQYGWTAGARPVPFGKREIMFIKMNPRTDSIYGKSPLEVLYDQILTLIYGSEYNLDFYLNNNIPNGFLTFKGASQPQADAYRVRLENQFMENDEFGNFKKKHFKVPITSYETQWTPMQMSSKEMEVIAQQQWFTKLVWACFGMTAAEMGFTEDSNQATDVNQSDVSKRRAIKPFLSILKYAINNQLMPEFGHPEFEFNFVDYDINEDIKKHALWEAQIRMGVRSSKQIATEELGIGEEEFEEAEQEKMEKAQAQADIESGEGEDGEDGEEDPEEPSEEMTLKEKVKKKLQDKKETEVKAQAIEAKPFMKSDKEVELEFDLYDDIDELRERVQEEVDRLFNIHKLTEIKGFIDVKSRVEDLLTKYTTFFETPAFKKKIEKRVQDAVDAGIEDFEVEFGVNTNPNEIKTDFLEDYVFENIKDMNEEMINKLRQTISRAILNKSTLEQATEQVQAVFDSTKDRARMIARTEMNRAQNIGANEAAIDSGLKLKKQWDSHLDTKTSKVCTDLDGKIVGINEKFKWQGEEFDLPPAHPNCRSRVIYIQED